MMSFSIFHNADEALDETQRRVVGVHRLTDIKMKTICNFTFSKKYFDFRDTLTRYYLYLPYAEVIELENYKVLGRTMTLKCFFDVRTGSLKYYIEADGCLIRTVGGQVRIDLPVSSTMPMQKYQQMREGSRAQWTQRNDVLLGAVGGLANGQLGSALNSVLGGGGGVLNIPANISTINEIKAPMGTQWSGNYSPTSSIEDPLNVYLFTVEPNIEYDEGIKNNYGLPSNKWSTIGARNGFVQCDDVRLTGVIPQDDKIEIINALKNGVYIV